MKRSFLYVTSLFILMIIINSCNQPENSLKQSFQNEKSKSPAKGITLSSPVKNQSSPLQKINQVSSLLSQNIVKNANVVAPVQKNKNIADDTSEEIKIKEDEDGNIVDREDGIELAQKQEFEKTKDVTLGYVPKYRLIAATEQLKTARLSGKYPLRTNALSWVERGPNSDGVGPTNGNGRPGTPTPVTSGRIRAVMVDISDATNKTVFVGGIDGGIWKTTDITASPTNWKQPTNGDFYSNLAVSSICQNPANPNIMYFGTGEKSYTGDAVRGGGIWRSMDHGVSWTLLDATKTFYNITKLACDGAGNLYAAAVGSYSSADPSGLNGPGIQRSTDNGDSWTSILPTGKSARVSEMKISSTGRLHITCGYYNTTAANAGYFYTDIPATVTPSTWTSPVTPFTPVQYNNEIATAGNTLYVLNSNSAFQTPTVYKSVDGGANWTLATNALPITGNNAVSSGQGYYNMAIAVDPVNPNNVTVGGLNCYKSTNGGTTFTQTTVWVNGISTTVTNYVHADQQFMTWNGNQVLVASDGGIFYSADGGSTYNDRNVGLRIKQFYSCALHPTQPNYFLAGAQDNGCHQLNSPGLGGSVEVTGGDGALVHIDQDEPQYQFGSYVYNQYRRSADGGNTWSSINFSSSIGQFINPSDYDDAANKFYAAYSNNAFLRWNDPQTGTSANAFTVTAFNGFVSSVMKSPYTANRVFFGSGPVPTTGVGGARIVRIDNANATPTPVDITGSGISANANTTISCVALGTNDNNLIATVSNYGVAHVWYSTTGGGASGWTNITGNLPDVPVRWAMFYPESNTKAMLATEMGVWETDNINGTSTVWVQNTSFPTVRTDMFQYRQSDATVLTATHGRGLWTATIPATNPYIRFAVNLAQQAEATTATIGCRNYKDYTVNMTIDAPPTGDAVVTLSLVGGGTALQGADFDFTTNGDFTTPSNTLTFTSGSSAPKPITIRVYDDAEVESAESFTLTYTVSGTTNALAAPSSSSLNYTIVDNDVAPASPYSGTYTLGSGTTTTTSATPFRSDLQRYRFQALYKVAELNAVGMTGSSKISSLNLRIATKNSTKPYTGFTISMANTSSSSLGSGYVSEPLTVVYSGNYSTVVGDNTFSFATPFAWDGVSNIAVQFCYDNGTAAVDAAADVTEVTVPSTTYFATNVWPTVFPIGDVAPTGSGCALDPYYVNSARINTKFSSASTLQIETIAGNNRVENVANNGTYYFYSSATGNLINRLSAVTANLGCVTSTIFEAGNTWQTFYGGMRSQKVIDITPTLNAGASYTVGLYYTTAELGGLTPAGLKIAHTSSTTTAGATSANTVIAPTTVTAFGTGYLFTASFTGFSKFFLTSNQVTWVGGTSTDWNTASNWSVNRVPDNTDYEIVIPAGTTYMPMITSGIQTANNLTILTGVTVTVNGSLQVAGTLSNNGVIAGTGNTVLNGTISQSITGIGTISNLTNSNSSTTVIASATGNMVNVTGVLTITAGTLTTNGNLTLKSNATATASVAAITGGTISGNVTMERFISDRKAWRLLGIPFSSSSQTIKSSWMENGAAPIGFGTQITTFAGDTRDPNFDAQKPASSIRTYSVDFNSDATHTPITSTLITANPSYFLYVRGDRTTDKTVAGSLSSSTILRSTGVINIGTLTKGTTSTDFSLIPNPYPSPVDFELVRNLAANVTTPITTFYVWDANLGTTGNYRTVTISGTNYTSTPADGTGGSANNNWRYIESGTSFFVPGSRQLQFTEATKTANLPTSSMLRTVNGKEAELAINLFSINADNSRSLYDGIREIFDNTFSAMLDKDDAKKLSSFDLNFGIESNNEILSVEQRPFPSANDVITLKLWNAAPGNYQFEVQPANFATTSQFVYLKDNYLNTYSPIDLRAKTTVNFSVTGDAGSAASSRFSIFFTNTAIAPGKSLMVIYPNPVQNGNIQLLLNNMPKGLYNVRLVNTSGQTILTKQINHAEGTSTETISVNRIKGAYMLEVTRPDNSKETNKVIIN